MPPRTGLNMRADDEVDIELASRDQHAKIEEKAQLLQPQKDSSNAYHRQQGHPATSSSTSAALEQHVSNNVAAQAHTLQNEALSSAAAAHQFIIQHHRMLTTFLVAISRLLENTDAILLPAVYLYVGCAFAATPAQLGSMTFTRLLSQAFASPLGGLLGHKLNRARLVGVACWYWAVCTALFAYSNSTWQGMVLWGFNGVGLGVMVPNAQSLIADYYDATHRGRAFGMLLAVGNLGAMVSSAYATNIAGLTILGLQGWRFAFLSVAAVSALAGAAMWAFARDPRCSSSSWALDPHWLQDSNRAAAGTRSQSTRSHSSRQGAGVSKVSASAWGSVRKLITSPLAAEVWVVITTPSFIVVVVQGFLGSMPWGAFAFTTLYLQLQGWSDAAASSIMALFSAADAAGAFLGGVVGDWAAARFPNHGRITACQFSVGIGVPLCLVIFQGLPLGSGAGVFVLYGTLVCLMGLLISWAATACNNPIFAEIVPAHLRTLVYAFDRCFEGALSSLGPPLVGLAAQRLFGFQGTAASAADCSSIAAHVPVHHEPDLVKARALGDALTLFSTVPWTLCAFVYTFLHWTYPKDKQRSSCTGDAVVPVDEFSALPATEAAAAVEWTPEHAVAAGLPAVLQRVDAVINQVDDYISNPRPQATAAAAAAPEGDAAGARAAVLSELELHDWENEDHHAHAGGSRNENGGLGHER